MHESNKLIEFNYFFKQINIFRIRVTAHLGALIPMLCLCASPLVWASAEKFPVLTVLQQKKGMEQVTYKWDKADSFSEVPPQLKRRGDAACLAQGANLESVGYHPHAHFNQTPISGGGFLCRAKSTGFVPQDPPPRMISENGIQGWDSPRSFGLLAENQIVQANAACLKADARLRAVAFHPRALDLQGRPLPGGAVFCAPIQNTATAAP